MNERAMRIVCCDRKHQLLTDQNKNFAPSIYFIIKEGEYLSVLYIFPSVVLSALIYILPSLPIESSHHHRTPRHSLFFVLYGCVHSPFTPLFSRSLLLFTHSLKPTLQYPYTTPCYPSRMLLLLPHCVLCVWQEKKRKEEHTKKSCMV